MKAERLIVGANLQPLEDAPPADALAISGGRIVAIGSISEIQDLRGSGTEVVDVGGATLMPAFTDSHTHFKRASAVLAYFINFDEVEPKSIGDVTEAVRRKAAELGPGAWVQGDSLAPSRLEEKRFPDRRELDDAAPDNPVVLRSVGRHVVAANSSALAAAGITRDTEAPQGGRIDREESGEPNGVLHEQAQLRLDANAADTVIPNLTVDDRLRALSHGVGVLNGFGIAAIHELPRDPDQISDWLQLREREDPRVRIRFYIRGLAAQTKLEYMLGLGLRGGFGDDWIRITGVKISIDGSDSYRNAMVYEPYAGEPDNYGLQRVPDGDLFEAVRLAHAARFPVAIHAIGQRAVDLALDAFAALDVSAEDRSAMRHRIEHAYLPEHDNQLQRMADLGLILSTQPGFLYADGDAWPDLFGDEECNGWLPLARAVDLGMHIQLNSDYPCSPLDPFIAVQTAATRTTRGGKVIDPDQAISVRQALQMMTAAPAWTAFEEHWRGRLRPGYAADLVLLDRDPLAVHPSELTSLRVLSTIVDGRTVHEA